MRIRKLLVVAALVAVALPAGGAAYAEGCAGPSAGGDWTSFGGDLAGTRSQAAETAITTDNVGDLVPRWTFSSTAAGGTGDIPSMPLVADGCVYIITTAGWLHALNADDGSVVWKIKLPNGVSPGAPAIADGVLYINQASSDLREGAHAVAIDAATGEIIWVSDAVATDASTRSHGAAVFDGIVFVPLQNPEVGGAVGGFALVDAATGSFLKRTYIVPEEQVLQGRGSCGIWTAPAFDAETKTAYAGTSQPATYLWFDNESEFCNAIVKIDMDRSSPTFGEILGTRKGTLDEAPYIDVDFGGGGPTLLRDANGRQIAVELQKSGWIHAGFTENMVSSWSQIVSVSPTAGVLGNYTAQATDGSNVFVVGAYPGQLFSLNGDSGAINWVTPVAAPFATNTVAYANGVVYFADELGILGAYDSATGSPLFTRPIGSDNADCGRNQSGGVSVARNTVFAACGPVVAAYGLPE